MTEEISFLEFSGVTWKLSRIWIFRFPVNSFLNFYFIIYIFILLYVGYLYYAMLYAIQTGGY